MLTGPWCHVGGVPGYGEPSFRVMGIGISPAQREMLEGKPFVGQSGKLLDALCSAVQFPRENWYLTNLVCTWNNTPTPDDIMACAPRLAGEIQRVNPKIIFTFGAIVTEALVGMKFGKCRGAVIKKGDRYYIPTYHPSGILQAGEMGASMARDVLRDLAKIPDVLQYAGDEGHVEYTIIDTPAEAQRVLDSLPQGALKVIDIETDARSSDKLDVYRDKLYCLSITCDNVTYTFTRDALDPGLRFSETEPYGFQFGMFDVNGIRKHFNVVLPITDDSGYLSYVLDERSGKDDGVAVHGLETLAREYENSGFYKDHIKSVWKELPYDALVQEGLLDINAKDSAYTSRLITRFIPRAQADGVYDLYKNILIPAANAFADITYEGAPIDANQLHELKMRWGIKYLQQCKLIQKLANEYGHVGIFNQASPQQLSKVLFQLLSLPDKSGKKSTAAEYLEELDHEFVDYIQINRAFAKMIGAYIMGVEDDIKQDARIHPEPSIHATTAGRLAYYDPPIQTIPQPYTYADKPEHIKPHLEELSVVRTIFPVESSDHVLLEVDYSQLEIWINAYLSGDQQMLEDLESGDFHGRVTTNVLHINQALVTQDVWANRRTQSKRVTFGILYGEGPQGLSNKKRGLGSTVSEAQKVINDYMTRYRDYNIWAQQQIHTLKTVGEIQTIFGRKRRVPFIATTHAYRQAINFPIQSTASDCCLLSLIELWQRFKQLNLKSRILWTVHDSILFSVHKAEWDIVLPLVHSVMTAQKHPALGPLKVDMKISETNLYETHKYEYVPQHI